MRKASTIFPEFEERRACRARARIPRDAEIFERGRAVLRLENHEVDHLAGTQAYPRRPFELKSITTLS